MKTKNSKVMLALFVVAALAMVSVAGAAMASEKADAKILTPVEHLTIDKDSTDWYGVYTSTETTATVKTDAKYTGQVHFGSYDTHSKIFDSKVILEFTDVNNLIINYDAASAKKVIMSGDTAGTIKVLKGEVQLGEDADKYFNGKVSGNTATVDVTNAFQLSIVAGDVDTIYGGILPGNKQAVDKDGKPAFISPGVPKLVPAVTKLEGSAMLGPALLVYESTFIIAEGATLTGDGNATAYMVKAGEAFDIHVGVATPIADGAVYDSDGRKVCVMDSITEGSIKFNPSEDLKVGSKYTLQVAGFENNIPYVYNGTLTFKAVLNTAGTVLTITASLSGSAQVSKLKAGDLTVEDARNLTFDPAKYRCIIANNAGTNVGDYLTKEGTITFTDVLDGALLVVLQDKATGKFYAYNGLFYAVDNTLSPTEFTKTYSVSTSSTYEEGKIYSAVGYTYDDADGIAAHTLNQEVGIIVSGFNAPSYMEVDGKLVLKYTNGDSRATAECGTFADSIINVKGVIEYQTDTKDDEPLKYTDTGSIKSGINAAHYVTGTAVPYTHYYTTLDKAMPESSDIKIFGILRILKDTTLNGKAAEGNKIAIQSDSQLIIGQLTDAEDNPAPITVVATVPKTTTFETESGIAVVLNGQLKIEDEAEDRGDSIFADVFYVSAPYGIYTDLVTALENAKSGDTVTVRPTDDNIFIGRNAEVKEGVTLDATGMNNRCLVVKSGVVFTMSGKMLAKCVTVMGPVAGDKPLDAGRLVLKSVEMEVSLGIALYGVLEFAPSFDNTTDANKDKFYVREIVIAGNMDSPSIIKVEGKLAYDLAKIVIAGSPAFKAVKFIVSGEANFKTAQLHLHTILDVTGTVRFMKGGNAVHPLDVAFSEIYATGKAKIVPASDGSNVGKVLVIMKAVFGAPADTLTQSINEVNATVYLIDDTDGQATVFGQAAKVSVKAINYPNTVRTPLSTEFIIKVDQQNKVLYQTIYAAAEDVQMKPLPTIEVTGYKQMSSWYKDFECTVFVPFADCGDFDKLYTGAEKLKYTITLEAQNGIKWRVDNVFKEGIVVLEYGEHKVNIETVKGYDISKVTLSKDGSAYTANSKFMLANNAVFSATAPAVVEEKSEFGLIEILLIIITIVIVIMVIIIAMKFMRS